MRLLVLLDMTKSGIELTISVNARPVPVFCAQMI
jgi:hypothetical protein